MAGRSSNATSTRDRLLLAAGQLLHEADGGAVSTRAICERAGVQAPTLYHHFGSKQGLLDAVVNYGFTQYVQAPETGGDPVARIREGWDRHVAYGLENPAFYVLLYGQIEPGVPCNLTSSAEAMLLELFTPLARAGRLRVEATEAARQFAAANSGVTLSLIAQPEGARDLAMSTQVRDAVLAGLLTDGPAAGSSTSALAVALSTALADDVDELTTTERQLLREWLHRLAS
ncbi:MULTISPECIES: TetR/AcrR family transcriptional regulator [unclassified Amycolatopsis]|uniref:TetR/AcrR family transcriptional regulator n=1 Tax=unclassified Amycolatopsis TaxID=2618356 RepID=UPI001FF12903|nr:MULTISPECIES: TetR/AcrR family transcriptional regulator [unclassified Amycolatopsis]UOZ07302.1 TetR/AcrR family transcriptional regulator [Amycolatopsis sp. WQ 127309]WSJ73553.1 TetR/AcrR family transcriptional regulator [Amycolatopsis sp. NBC_01307]WSK82793.1 TetR/AcrR family transcriptional regulator [Amycolatopsis sp. NBC_01286]